MPKQKFNQRDLEKYNQDLDKQRKKNIEYEQQKETQKLIKKLQNKEEKIQNLEKELKNATHTKDSQIDSLTEKLAQQKKESEKLKELLKPSVNKFKQIQNKHEIAKIKNAQSELNFEKLNTVINNASADSIANEFNFETFLSDYPDLIQRQDLIETIVKKIKAAEKQYTEFEARALAELADTILKINENKKPDIRFENTQKAIEILNDALKISLEQNLTANNLENRITTVIEEYPNIEEAFELSKQSISQRQKSVNKKDEESIRVTKADFVLSALNLAAKLSQKIEQDGVKVEGLKQAVEAYNIGMKESNITHAKKALINLSELYKQLGDQLYSEFLAKKSEELTSIDNLNGMIKIMGNMLFTDRAIEIQKIIQDPVLNNIVDPVKKGKYINYQIMGNYGISGYTGSNMEKVESLLKTKLSDYTESDLNIAKYLILRTSFVAIDSSDEKIPTAAVLFFEKHIDAEGAIQNAPEIFVNLSNLKLLYTNIVDYSEDLCGVKVDVNNYLDVNTAKEEAFMPLIAERLMKNQMPTLKNVINPKNTIEYMTKTVSSLMKKDSFKKNIGQMVEINDIENMVRMEIFNASYILAKQSNLGVNFLYGVVQNHPDIINRILHTKDWIKDEHVHQVFENIINSETPITYNDKVDLTQSVLCGYADQKDLSTTQEYLEPAGDDAHSIQSGALITL